MTRRYYSSRKTTESLTLQELYWKLRNLYLLYRDKDYFKQRANITKNALPDSIQHEAAIALNFQLFPLTRWAESDITDDHIFDALEFLYDHVSKPGEWGSIADPSGFERNDYLDYDVDAGREEFREKANIFLADYKSGYELTKDGLVLTRGTAGLQEIFNAEIVAYDEVNVDSKVRRAIEKWRNRHLSWSERKEAIRELADVFEWLKKTKALQKVLDGKDESILFDLANNFGIRHHDPKQKTHYDRVIWYAWMFHFYLATYHAAIRLLVKHEQASKSSKP
ncbi:MAG TPA: hypothetical protein VKH81_07025 [Candidatus Angelobacter sp.]|nr:hypothetical protein [Candidatus Angelobacter sp.]